MVKWLISVLAVVAVASAGYSGPQGPQAPVLPKGNVATVFLPEVQLAPAVHPVYQSNHQQPAQQQPQQQQTYAAPAPVQQQPQQTYAAPAPAQQQPQPQQTYAAPTPVQQQQPQKQSYVQQPAQQQAQQQQTYAAPGPVSGYDRQRQFSPYSPATVPVQQTPPKENYCQQNNLVEGYHSPGCSQFYFACFPLDTIRVTCPANLYYDAEVQQCDYKHFIAACGGQRPPAQTEPLRPYGEPQAQPQQQPAAPKYTQPQQQPPQNSYANVQQTPPKPVETFCLDRSLSDGFYGKGCSSQFYVCALGQTTRLDCPTGLFYDQETNECGHKAVIVACGGQKPTQPPALQPPMLGPYGQSQLPKQPPPPEFDCSSRKDGIYIRGCSTRYFVCIQGTVMPLSCPSGTFYSAFTEMCDYKANVVECGGIAPTKTPVAQNPVMIPQSPYGRRPQKASDQASAAYGQSSPAQQEPGKSNNPCATLSNGIYGRKCSRFFFVCATQKTYDFICPKDHAFNLKTVKCAPKIEITTCPEFETPPTSIQQTPRQPIEIQPQAAPSYSAPAPAQEQPQKQSYVQQPAQQQPQQQQTYAAPAPVQQQQPQQQSYAAPAPVQQQQPQKQSYVQQPVQQQPQQQQTYAAPAPQQQQPQPTYQRPLAKQQPQIPQENRQQY